MAYYPAKKRYAKKALVNVTVQFNRNTEAELIEHVEKQPNKSGYIKGLIRADIAKAGEQ